MTERNPSTPKLTASILSGILLGLSVPSFSPVPLGFMAWFWLVPLLFELRRDQSLKFSVMQSLVAVAVGFSMSYLWVVNASISGFLLAVVSGILVWMVPMSVFHLMRRICGWDTALVALPFIWTFWEWFYHSTEISSSVRLGNSQAEMNWLVQFADLFGVNGITFWLITINILIFRLCERVAQMRSETNADRTLLRVPALLVSVGFLLPFGYAVYIFNRPEPATLAAFDVAGDQAVTLHAGTWHHGLIALADGDFVVIERKGAAVDCDVAELPEPVTLLLAA